MSQENITEESIERLYQVNRIRDTLHDNSEQLKFLGVKKVWFFGSVHDGRASSSSDIDLCFIHNPLSDSFIQYSDEFENLQRKIEDILRPVGLPIAFFPPKNIMGTTILHINLQPDNAELDSKGKPKYMKDSYVLWQA